MNKKLELLERYTSGAATPEERQLVEDWFAALDMPVTAWDDMSPAMQNRLIDFEIDLIETAFYKME